MLPKFEIFEGKRRTWLGRAKSEERWYFQLVAPNGERQDISEPYTTQTHTINGVYALCRNVLLSCGLDPDVIKPEPVIVFRDPNARDDAQEHSDFWKRKWS